MSRAPSCRLPRRCLSLDSALVKREAQVGILTWGESSFARARENSFAAYKGGVVSLIEVLDADGNLLQARDAKALGQTEAARAAIASFRALGGGWDARDASSNGLYSNLSSTNAGKQNDRN